MAPWKQLRLARSRAWEAPAPARGRYGGDLRDTARTGRHPDSSGGISHFDDEIMTGFGDYKCGGSRRAAATIPAAGIL